MARNLSPNLIYVSSRKNIADTPSQSFFSVLLPGIKWTQLLALTVSIWRLFRLTCKSIAPVVFSDSSLRFLMLARWECRGFFSRSFSLVGFWSLSAPKNAPFSVVVPDLSPGRFWWPLVSRNAACAFKLGSKGDTNVLLFPPDLAPLCGNHAFYSGIFGFFWISSVWDCRLRSSRTREIASAAQHLRKERSIPSRCYYAFCKPCVVCYTL